MSQLVLRATKLYGGGVMVAVWLMVRAMALMLFTGLRRQDAIRLGPPHIRNGNIEIVVLKTKAKSPEQSVKPMLPELAEIIAATPRAKPEPSPNQVPPCPCAFAS